MDWPICSMPMMLWRRLWLLQGHLTPEPMMMFFHKVRDRFGIQVIPMRGARVLNDGMHHIHSTRNGMKHCIAVVVRGAAPTRIFHGRHTWTQEPDEFKRLLEQCTDMSSEATFYVEHVSEHPLIDQRLPSLQAGAGNSMKIQEAH